MKRNTHGISLLELLMVLVLIAVALSILLPQAIRLTQSPLHAHVQELRQALSECKLQAMTSGKAQTFVWTPATRIWLTPTRQGRIDPKIAVHFTGAQLAPSNGAVIIFSPDGKSSGGRFELQYKFHTQRLDVDWLSAQTRLSIPAP